jgi:hypothetical protein
MAAELEAGCKVAIGTRLERTGMHWSLLAANSSIALRRCKLSGRFEDFWERRAAQRTAYCAKIRRAPHPLGECVDC